MAIDIERLIHEIDDGCLSSQRMKFGLLGVFKRRTPAAIGIEGVDNHQFGVGRNDEFRIEQASRLFFNPVVYGCVCFLIEAFDLLDLCVV